MIAKKVLIVVVLWVVLLGVAAVVYHYSFASGPLASNPPPAPTAGTGDTTPTSPRDPAPTAVNSPRDLLPVVARPVDAEWITPREAAKRVGQSCRVEMVVRLAFPSRDKAHVFLISEADSSVPGNLTVAIFSSVKPEVQAAVHADDLLAYFRGKTIRVSGEVEEYQGRAEIKIHSASQIDVVSDAK